jgi:hypothetical protein
LEEVANIRSIQNSISYLHANLWIFSPFLAIFINFLNSKTYHDFPMFLFKIHLESDEVPMEKVVPFFKTFTIIFVSNFLSSGRSFLEWSKFERI